MDIIAPLLVLAAIGVAGLIALFVAMPFLLNLASLFEAFGIIGQGFDEYFNRPGLSRGCCLIGTLFLVVGCFGCIVLFVAGISCFTASPSSICRLIGR